jgi:hypothetical protein
MLNLFSNITDPPLATTKLSHSPQPPKQNKEAKLERELMDLKLESKSLLHVNTNLEETVKQQAARINKLLLLSAASDEILIEGDVCSDPVYDRVSKSIQGIYID